MIRPFSALVTAFLLVGFGLADEAKTNEVKPNPESGTLEVHYHRFVLLKYDGKIIALHLLPDPSHGHDGIHYRWYHLTDGTDRFYRPAPGQADKSPNQDLKTGGGETHEGKEGGFGEGLIKAGPLTMVVACWLEVEFSRFALIGLNGQPVSRSQFLVKWSETALRKYLTALRTLATVRARLPEGLAPPNTLRLHVAEPKTA